jgi:hypothetical protein
MIYLQLSFEFEGYEFQSDNFFERSRRMIFNIISSNFVDNSNRIYEYDIDSETIKIKKLLFKFAFRAGEISWVQDTISEFDYFLNIFFEKNINEIIFFQK